MASKRTLMGVDLSKVNEEVLNKALSAKNLAGGGSKDKRVERMACWVSENTRPEDLLECDTCGGASDTCFDVCPFCGAVEAEEDVAEAIVLRDQAVEAIVVDGQAIDEAMLDKIVQRVGALKQSMTTNYAKNYYQIGVELKRVKEMELWRLRTKENGGVAYKGFVDFLRREVGISHPQAQKIIRVAEVFSEAEVVEHGHTRLAAALNLPLPLQMAQKLLEDGASKREIQAQVKELKDRERPTPPTDQVTVALMKGQTSVDLFARLTDGSSNPRRAVSVEDDPWGELHLANNVVMGFRLTQNRAGEFILVVDVKRDSTAAAG